MQNFNSLVETQRAFGTWDGVFPKLENPKESTRHSLKQKKGLNIKSGYSAPDDMLLKGCIRQKPKAQEALYKRFYPYGMSVALRYACEKEAAAEILNDAFFKVFSSIKKYKKEYPFKSWFRRIVINTAIDHYRANKKHRNNVLLSDWSAQTTGHNPEIIEHLNAENILSYLEQLSQDHRITFLLYEVEGYSHKEIAEKLSVSVGTSRANLSRAKEKLRAIILRNE